jgi:C-terminal processing protease CtpA/Prc
MKIKEKLMFLLFFLAGMMMSCQEELMREEAPELTQKVNEFIETAMNDVYLWYQEIPDIDIRYEFDSEKYFEKLLYEEDKWSFITDDIESLENSLEGIEKSFGYSLAFGQFSNTGTIFAIVEFVYPNTPAEVAGLKRGDIIVEMNNADITEDNYTDLLYAESLTITLGISLGTSISEGSKVSMTAQVLNLDPVMITKVIEHGGHKIGYLFYAQYIDNYNTSLDNAFQYFFDQQITDLVVDLRYNPGGYTSAAQHLCSSVAPLSAVNTNSTLVTFQWNDKYQEYWERKGMDDQLEIPFVNTVAVKLGLGKLYFLTGYGTASASELSITGLKPYMDVVTVGDTTYGKYTASITLKPEDIYDDEDDYSKFDNWGIQPIVIRYANSEGVTDFKDGFAPDIPVYDDLWEGVQLGETQEPLLKAAIEDITGAEVLALKKAKVKVPFTLFDRGFSKFDDNKHELIFDGFLREK